MERVKAGYWLDDGGRITLESVNSGLFTHIFFAFADLQSNRVVILPQNQHSASRFTAVLRRRNPSVKTLLSIGGAYSEGPVTLVRRFAAMVGTRDTRKIFIDSSIAIARANNFNGLDLDYEVPETQDDMSNLSSLLREWKAAVDIESRATNRPALLLTAAVRHTNTNYSGNPYPAQEIARSLDWINIMAYDFASPNPQWGTPQSTGPTAVLYNPNNPAVSGSGGINAWIQGGVPRSKLVLGIPFYGYAWKLVNPFNHGYWAPATGADTSVGDRDGAVTYNGIAAFLRNNGGETVYDERRVGAYSYTGRTWISYDNEAAVADKVNYVKGERLLGYFGWQIGGDDNFALATAAFNAALP